MKTYNKPIVVINSYQTNSPILVVVSSNELNGVKDGEIFAPNAR